MLFCSCNKFTNGTTFIQSFINEVWATNIGIVSVVTQTMSSCSNHVQSDEINTVEPDIYYHTAAS